MIGIQSVYVEAIEGQIEGQVFPIKPGCEREAIELIRTVVDRLTERAGRGEERPEMLGVFVAADTVQNVIPDGTHEPFLAEVMGEIRRREEATRRRKKRDETEV